MLRRRYRSSKRGVALVETALVLPLLLVLALGAFDLGRVLIVYVEIEEAAHEGAVFGSFQPGGDIVGRVRTSSDGVLDLTDAAVEVEVTCPSGGVAVTVRYDMPLVTPIIGPMFGGDIAIGSRSVGTVFGDGACVPT